MTHISHVVAYRFAAIENTLSLLKEKVKNTSMKKLPLFFVIGAVGIIGTVLLHVFVALVIHTTGRGAFLAMYPTFAAFLVIGILQLLDNDKLTAEKVRANNKRLPK